MTRQDASVLIEALDALKRIRKFNVQNLRHQPVGASGYYANLHAMLLNSDATRAITRLLEDQA